MRAQRGSQGVGKRLSSRCMPSMSLSLRAMLALSSAVRSWYFCGLRRSRALRSGAPLLYSFTNSARRACALRSSASRMARASESRARWSLAVTLGAPAGELDLAAPEAATARTLHHRHVTPIHRLASTLTGLVGVVGVFVAASVDGVLRLRGRSSPQGQQQRQTTCAHQFQVHTVFSQAAIAAGFGQDSVGVSPKEMPSPIMPREASATKGNAVWSMPRWSTFRHHSSIGNQIVEPKNDKAVRRPLCPYCPGDQSE